MLTMRNNPVNGRVVQRSTVAVHRGAAEMRPMADIPLFQGLDEPAMASVAAAARRVRFEPDEVVFRQGDAARAFFILLRGEVKVTEDTPEGDQVVAQYAGVGDVFGYVSLYGHEEYLATGLAVTSCEALVWDHRTTERLMEIHPLLAINALRFLGKELTGIRTRYRELATERVERRVARALERLVRQAGRKVDAGVLIDFPVTRQDLAQLTGTTLHTVSRILSEWERRGIIQSGRRRILIRNPHGLISIAEDLDTPQHPEIA